MSVAASRRTVVIEYPIPFGNVDRAVLEALELVRRAVGLVSSLVTIPLLLTKAGDTFVGASSGTAVAQATATWDLEDARIDQLRLVAYGMSSASGHSLRLKRGSTVLCTVSLGNAGAARCVGSWTVVKLPAGDQSYDLEVVGNGSATQTLYRVELQARTQRLGPA